MKELLSQIKECKTDEELEELAKVYIKFYTEEAGKYNIDCNTIGTDVGINPRNYTNEEYDYGLNIWCGYIPKNTRIVYAVYGYSNYRSSNGGQYYYLDDESYILDFFKYIKDKDIDDNYDFILCVNKFLKQYLVRDINKVDREEMFKLICKNEEDYYEPIKEHSILDFKNNGAAECSEYSAITENIFSIFGFDIYYMMDRTHAYNLLIEEGKVSILDYANWVCCFDINYKYLGRLPYYVEIPEFDDELFDNIKNFKERIKLPDYYFLVMNDDLIEVRNGEERDYGIDGMIKEETKILK